MYHHEEAQTAERSQGHGMLTLRDANWKEEERQGYLSFVLGEQIRVTKVE